MGDVKLTKDELRSQQQRLTTLQTYLPTLQLKKAMLQAEINDARVQLHTQQEQYQEKYAAAEEYSPLLLHSLPFKLKDAVAISSINRRYDNVAGVEIPYLESIHFADFHYDFFDTPPWVDSLIGEMKKLSEVAVKVKIAKEKKEALETELRSVSIKVNLFEKILIPRCKIQIKKIKIFLGDQQLAAVARAKVAKGKIERKKNLVYREQRSCAST